MKRNAQAAAVLTIMFAAGAIAGYRLGRDHDPAAARRRAMLSNNVAEYEALGLSDAQRDRLSAVLEASRPATDRLLDSIEVRLRLHLDSVEVAIRSILQPDQLRMLDSLRDAGALPLPQVKARRPSPPR